MSLEVAEYLSGKAGARLIHTLTQAAPLVMFSAAVPGHAARIISQWPGYWRSLFADEGLRLFDSIRPLIAMTVPCDGGIGRICFFLLPNRVCLHIRDWARSSGWRGNGMGAHFPRHKAARFARDLTQPVGGPWLWSQVKTVGPA
jgi:hypothetical protein